MHDRRHEQIRHNGVSLLVLATVAVSVATACRKSNPPEYGAQNADTGAAAATPAAVPNSTATTAPQTLTDPNIVYILDQANAADSARGTLAATKGTSADVKRFGKLMAGEHHALRMEGAALAKKLGVTPEAPAGDQSEAQATQEMDTLTATPAGAAWDKAYIDYEVTYHQAVLATATKALDAAQNAQLKALIKKAAPVLQHHLDRAEQIQKKLASS